MKDVKSGKKLLETLPCIKVIIWTQFDFFDRKLVQRCPTKCFTHQLTTKGKLFQRKLNNMVQYSQTWGRKAWIHLQNSWHALRRNFCMSSQMLKMKLNVTIQIKSKYQPGFGNFSKHILLTDIFFIFSLNIFYFCIFYFLIFFLFIWWGLKMNNNSRLWEVLVSGWMVKLWRWTCVFCVQEALYWMNRSSVFGSSWLMKAPHFFQINKLQGTFWVQYLNKSESNWFII